MKKCMWSNPKGFKTLGILIMFIDLEKLSMVESKLLELGTKDSHPIFLRKDS